MDATETLVRFILETNYETLPSPVVDAAKIGILDGVKMFQTCGSATLLTSENHQYE